MITFNFSEIQNELLSLSAATKIELCICADFCDFDICNYICTVVDALIILPLFGEDYLYTYKILSK